MLLNLITLPKKRWSLLVNGYHTGGRLLPEQ
uniref:Uncharacterized protein n=1 Tax=Rhizophora mucronata TaxID=61149 RepID=A0A2P2Q8T1_RHIMU